jgi:hypothetical protein
VKTSAEAVREATESPLAARSADVRNEPAGALLALQRAAGNAAVSSLVRRALQRDVDPDEAKARADIDEEVVLFAQHLLKDGRQDIGVQSLLWKLIRSRRLDDHYELRGSRYEKGQKGVDVKLHGKGAATTGILTAGDDVVKRVAAGQVAGVVKELEAALGKVDATRGTVDYVFIMGADIPRSGNPFYTEAKKFFAAKYASAELFDDVRDLDGINRRINDRGKPVANIYIVSHAHPDGTLQFSLDPSDPTPGQMEYRELKAANEKGSLTKPDPKLVGFWTFVHIRGCNLGRNYNLLDETKKAFGGARVTAPTHEQIYGGGVESMGGAFYEEPGVSKLSGKQALVKIKAKPEYRFVTDWGRMAGSLKKSVQSIPEIVYEGAFPAPKGQVAFLNSQLRAQGQRALNARDIQSMGSTIEGDETVFTFTPRDSTGMGVIEIRAKTPPTDAQAIADAKKTVARPEAFGYRVTRQRSGQTLQVTVHVERTEWELWHTQLRKGGKPFNPVDATEGWYGDTRSPP